ncbi:calcium-binding protein [Marivivens marinus]|uniref:calcium-binding protein n=1 Tax=Marivivens marinus TaxID=3110173 RepID=UPI003B84AA9F
MEALLLLLVGTIALAAAFSGFEGMSDDEFDEGSSTDDTATGILELTGPTVGTDGVTLEGSSISEILEGTESDETLHGYGGDDVILGGGGHDEIYGGEGDDRFLDQSPNDVEDDGNDTIFGGSGNDVVADTFAPYGPTNDRGGDDTFYGGSGNDRFVDFAGSNFAFGGDGDDILSGLDSDVWEDSSGFSSSGPYATLFPSTGDPGNVDSLFGEAGNDTLIGDAGDLLVGGDGFDTFKVEQHFGAITPTTIADWESLGLSGAESIEVQIWMDAATFQSFFPGVDPWSAEGVQAEISLLKVNQTVQVEALGQTVLTIQGIDDSTSLSELHSSIVIRCNAALYT